MGFSAIASSRTTQTGSYQSQVATAVNTAANANTGTITAAGSWSSVIDGQAFAVERAGVVIAVRCIRSVSGGLLTYYRLYLDDGSELATDVQVGDTIILYELPETVGGGAVLSAVAGITLVATGSADRTFREYTVGNNALAVSGYLQIPSKHLLLFGTSAPGQTIRIDAGGRLAIGWYRTIGGITVFCEDLLIRGTKSEGAASSTSNSILNPNTATSRLDWFGGIEESASLCLCDVAGATSRIYSKAARTRALNLLGSEAYQSRISSADCITYGWTCENRMTVLIAAASIGGYSPRHMDIAFSFSSSTPDDTWITINDPVLNGGNVADVGFWSNVWVRIVNNATGSAASTAGNNVGSHALNRGLIEFRAKTTLAVADVLGSGVTGRVFCRDTNNGSRLAANVIGVNPTYVPDRTYEAVISGGAAVFTTDGGILLAASYQNTANASITRFQNIVWDYRGRANNSTDVFRFALASYGKLPATTDAILKGVGGATVSYTMLDDAGVTASRATAATYSDRISINGSGHITVTANATLDQLYDYTAWWLEQSGANMEIAGLGSRLVAWSADELSTTRNVTVATGVTLSPGAKFASIQSPLITISSTAVMAAGIVSSSGVVSTVDIDQLLGTVRLLGTARLDLSAPGTAPEGSSVSGSTVRVTTATAADVYAFEAWTFVAGAIFENTSGQPIVLQLASGQTAPTLLPTSGAITIQVPPSTLVISNIWADSRIIIYNESTDAVLHDAIVAGTSLTYNYTEGGTITAGDIIRVYYVWYNAVDGSTASKRGRITITPTAAGGSASLEMEFDPVYAEYYATFGVTGAAVAASGDYVRDLVNLQIDLDDADDTWFAHRMYMWDKYDIWNNTGRRAVFTQISATDSGNISIGTLLLDNLNVNTAKQGDTINVVNASSTLPVQNPTTGGGGITMYSGGKVLTTTAGGISPSEAQIKTWVRAELATELARIDAAVSSRNAVAPDNASIAAIKAKTDNLPSDPADASVVAAQIAAIPAAPSAATNASAVRTELATELSRIDATISSRNAVAPDNANIAAIKAKTDNLPSDPADASVVSAEIAVVSAQVAALPVPPSAATNASAVRTELTTELGRIDATVSSRNAVAPDNAGIAAIKKTTALIPALL